jgi:hypothetical protein
MLAELSKAIISCNRERQKYSALGQFFMDFWIRPCTFDISPILLFKFVSIPLVRKYKGRIPLNSGHVSRPSFDIVVEQMQIDLVQYPRQRKGGSNTLVAGCK